MGCWKTKWSENYSTAEYRLNFELRESDQRHLCFSRLVDGQYWTVTGVEWKDGWPQLQLEGEDGRGDLVYDPPTFMRISRTPLVPDEYEEETVVVGLSSVPGAGEGIFARWSL